MSTMSRAAAGLVAIAFVLILPPAVAQGAEPAIDPKAREVLQEMGRYAESLKSFEVRGDNSSDHRLDNGMLVERATRTTLLVQRPDRFRGTIVGDDRHQYLYLRDGELTLYTHDRGYYAQAEVPKSVGKAMEYALDEFGLEAPLMDLLFEDSSERFIDGVEAAMYLGESQVRGVDCHQIALRDPEVDVQLWVTTGDKPLMKKFVIAYRWVTGSPKFSAVLDWDIAPKIDDETFTFKPPSGSMKIEFTRTSQ